MNQTTKHATQKAAAKPNAGKASTATSSDLNKGIAAFEKGEYKTALNKFKPLAGKGLAEAQAYLGVMYSNGLGVTKDDAQALDWYQKAAAQGHAGAQNNLGVMYEYGDGVPQDPEKAFNWYLQASAQGRFEIQINLGRIYSDGNGAFYDSVKAVAEQGYMHAQYFLGLCYRHGQDDAKDLSQAVMWFEKAAAQGYMDAQADLADMYRCGTWVSQDLAKAAEWYEKAAEQGYMHAQYFLGACYRDGEGVAKDLTKAVEWYEKAAAQGDKCAQSTLGDMYRYGDGVSQDLAKAAEWYEKAAEQGHERAKEQLSMIRNPSKYREERNTNTYWYEQNTKLDLAKAYLEMGDLAGACEMLEKVLRDGDEEQREAAQELMLECNDPAKTIQRLEEAAVRGDAYVQFNLGNMYKSGEGVAKDEAKAVEWYEKAAAQGHEDAKTKLCELRPQHALCKK